MAVHLTAPAQEARSPPLKPIKRITKLVPTKAPVSASSAATTLVRQLSALASLLWDSTSGLVHDVTSYALGCKPRQTVIPAKSVILVTGCNSSGLARELALRFASAGYVVFAQAPPDQVGPLIARWQELKQRLTSCSADGAPHSGLLMPLGFYARDASARLAAVKTITAFCREHDKTLAAVVNCIDATGSPRYRAAGSSLSVNSDASEQPPPKAALRSSGGRSSSLHDSLFAEIPLPLSISTEEHLNEMMAEIVSVVGVCVSCALELDRCCDTKLVHVAGLHCWPRLTTTQQDMLPALRSSRGKVLNVWCRAQSLVLPHGPLAMAEDAFRAASRTLALELRPFGICVSTILPGATTLLASKSAELATPPTISVTSDSRSILTPASDPAIRSAFSKQVKLAQQAVQYSNVWRIDDSLVFRVVRHALEARYPRAVYPIGLDQLALEFTSLLPTNMLALLEQVINQRQRKRLA